MGQGMTKEQKLITARQILSKPAAQTADVRTTACEGSKKIAMAPRITSANSRLLNPNARNKVRFIDNTGAFGQTFSSISAQNYDTYSGAQT
jgi:hypothetical protein